MLERNVGEQSLKVVDAAIVPFSIDSNLKHDLGGPDRLPELQGLKKYTDIDTIANAWRRRTPAAAPANYVDLAYAAYVALGLEQP